MTTATTTTTAAVAGAAAATMPGGGAGGSGGANGPIATGLQSFGEVAVTSEVLEDELQALVEMNLLSVVPLADRQVGHVSHVDMGSGSLQGAASMSPIGFLGATAVGYTFKHAILRETAYVRVVEGLRGS